MNYDDITTEELHLAYRVVAVIAGREIGEPISEGVFGAAAELLRIAYRARTQHDPLPGQLYLPG